MQDNKDESGLQLINFDFVTVRGLNSLEFFSHCFVFSLHITLRSSLLAFFFSHFKIIKQA